MSDGAGTLATYRRPVRRHAPAQRSAGLRWPALAGRVTWPTRTPSPRASRTKPSPPCAAQTRCTGSPLAGEPGFWAVLRHADVVHVARHPEVFSSHAGGITRRDVTGPTLQRVRNMLQDRRGTVATGPPTALRPRMIADLEHRCAQRAGRSCASCRPAGQLIRRRRCCGAAQSGHRRVVRPAAGRLGVPAHPGRAHHREPDPDLRDSSGRAAERRRGDGGVRDGPRGNAPHRHGDDLASAILQARFGGEPMSDNDFGGFFVQLVTAGNDTTRGMLSSGLLTLLRHDQLAELRADPGLLSPRRRGDPALRQSGCTTSGARRSWIPNWPVSTSGPVTKWRCTTLRQPDDDVFDDPQSFDIHRRPNPPPLVRHGRVHFVWRASLEARVFRNCSGLLASNFAGRPERIRSNLNNFAQAAADPASPLTDSTAFYVSPMQSDYVVVGTGSAGAVVPTGSARTPAPRSSSRDKSFHPRRLLQTLPQPDGLGLSHRAAEGRRWPRNLLAARQSPSEASTR